MEATNKRMGGITILLLVISVYLTPAVSMASLIEPVIIVKCKGPAVDGKAGGIDFKLVIYENEFDGRHPGEQNHTSFKGSISGIKIKARGLTSRVGYTPNHKAIFETTFPAETSDMRYVTIRFATGSVPGGPVLEPVLMVPPLGRIPASIPLTCIQSYSFRP